VILIGDGKPDFGFANGIPAILFLSSGIPAPQDPLVQVSFAAKVDLLQELAHFTPYCRGAPVILMLTANLIS